MRFYSAEHVLHTICTIIRLGYPVVQNEYPGDESKNFGRRQHLSLQ